MKTLSPHFRVFLLGCAVIALALLCCPAIGQAHERPAPPAPAPAANPPAHPFWLTPDDSGGRTAHAGVSAAIGLGVTRLWPEHAPLSSWLLCQAPGLAKEVLIDWQHKRTGVSRSDLRANALGCLAGVSLGRLSLHYAPPAGGGVGLALAIPFH